MLDAQPGSDDISAHDIDVRSVHVIWADAPLPDVSFYGCSAYEAIGLLRGGLRWLEKKYEIPVGEDDDDDDLI